jgi:hypothetical protein
MASDILFDSVPTLIQGNWVKDCPSNPYNVITSNIKPYMHILVK